MHAWQIVAMSVSISQALPEIVAASLGLGRRMLQLLASQLLHMAWMRLTMCSCCCTVQWGYTGTFDRENGGSFLVDHFPNATKAIWDFEGVYCHSRHIPGVSHPAPVHVCVLCYVCSTGSVVRSLAYQADNRGSACSLNQPRWYGMLPTSSFAQPLSKLAWLHAGTLCWHHTSRADRHGALSRAA